MTTIELNTKDLQIINGGTKKDYNNGHDLGAKCKDFLLYVARYSSGNWLLY